MISRVALLTLKDIALSVADKDILCGVSLTVQAGDRIAVVGRNGAGKSTLLRVIAGTMEHTDGDVLGRKHVRVAHLEQEPEAPPDEPSHQEQVFRSKLDARGGHSGGEKRRVALAHVLAQDADLLLLDEPTNHLDAIVITWLERELARRTIIMVTHDRYFLDRVANRIIELDRGKLYNYDGGYTEFLEKRAQRMNTERKAETSRVNLLRREREWMQRGPQGRATKAKARITRYETLEGGRREDRPGSVALQIPSGPPLGKKVVEIEGVSKRYGDRVLFENLDLEIGRRECVGIVGKNGAGKTTLLKICLGLLEPDAGRVALGNRVQVAYVDQAREQLNPRDTVLEAVAGGSEWVHLAGKPVRIEAFLARFLFAKEMFPVPVGQLSGGERNRILLARLLLQGGNVLALDEPTNDLDLETLRALEEALLAFPGTTVVVSHDRWFLDRVADRILFLDGEGHVIQHPGSVSELLDALPREKKPKKKKADGRRSSRSRAKKLSYRERQELDGLPDQIAKHERELAALDHELAQSHKKSVRDLVTRRANLAATVETLYARWQELEQSTSELDKKGEA